GDHAPLAVPQYRSWRGKRQYRALFYSGSCNCRPIREIWEMPAWDAVREFCLSSNPREKFAVANASGEGKSADIVGAVPGQHYSPVNNRDKSCRRPTRELPG